MDGILKKMRKEDRLLKESSVMKAVQKEIINMGYEPFEDKVMGIYDAIEKVSQICTLEEFDNLNAKNEPKEGIPYNSDKNKFVECPNCHKDMDLYYDYCHYCGQKVKWQIKNNNDLKG